MAKRSKFFCIAVEGATCDGRTLDRAALEEMAATYDPKTYTARVNMEHIRGFSADPPFCAYGDVAALKTQEVTLKVGGQDVKKLGLFAQVDALDNLLAVQAKGQKLFSSIELNPAFADSGKAYLQGLAVTDSPASLGTEIMTFAATQGDKSPFASRKQAPGNFFSAAHEISIEWEDGAAPANDGGVSAFFAAAAAAFARFTAPKEEPKSEPKPPAAEGDAGAIDQRFAAVAEGIGQMTQGLAAFTGKIDSDLAALRGEISSVKASIETTPKPGERRPVGTGGVGNFAKTDC